MAMKKYHCLALNLQAVVQCRRPTRKLAVRIEHHDCHKRGCLGCGVQSVGVHNTVWGGEIAKEASQHRGGGQSLPNH